MKLLALVLLAAVQAHAAVVAEATNGEARLELHDEAGPCLGAARLAVFSRGPERLPGCWIFVDNRVQIAFLDGDIVRLPAGVFAKPKSS